VAYIETRQEASSRGASSVGGAERDNLGSLHRRKWHFRSTSHTIALSSFKHILSEIVVLSN
jgi:hypothetical protein